MFKFVKIFVFLLFFSFALMAQSRAQAPGQGGPYTIAYPSTAGANFIGVDIPSDQTHETAIKMEYVGRFIYVSILNLHAQTRRDIFSKEDSYQLDLYFGYISVVSKKSDHVTFSAQFQNNDKNWQRQLQKIKHIIKDALKRLPSNSDDYNNVLAVLNKVNSVMPPVSNAIGLVYGQTEGWVMTDYDLLYYSVYGPPDNTTIGFTKTERYLNWSPGPVPFVNGKMWRIRLDMVHSLVKIYYMDAPRYAFREDVFKYSDPVIVISQTDPGWKQALMEVLLIAQNGGLNNPALTTSDKQQIINNIQAFIAAHP